MARKWIQAATVEIDEETGALLVQSADAGNGNMSKKWIGNASVEINDETGALLVQFVGGAPRGFTFKGAFAYGAFEVNDVVTYNGSLYICNTAIPSEGGTPDADSRWTLAVQKGADGSPGASFGNWAGTWQNGTYYNPADLVQFEGSLYRCKQSTNYVQPTDTSFWDLLVLRGQDGQNGQNAIVITGNGGEWGGANYYTPGYTYHHNGAVWIALSNVSYGSEPGVNNGEWALLSYDGQPGQEGQAGISSGNLYKYFSVFPDLVGAGDVGLVGYDFATSRLIMKNADFNSIDLRNLLTDGNQLLIFKTQDASKFAIFKATSVDTLDGSGSSNPSGANIAFGGSFLVSDFSSFISNSDMVRVEVSKIGPAGANGSGQTGGVPDNTSDDASGLYGTGYGFFVNAGILKFWDGMSAHEIAFV